MQINCEIEEMQAAYKKSCEDTGILFHNIVSMYEDAQIPLNIVERFKELGMDLEGIDTDHLDEDMYLHLLEQFIVLSLPGFNMKEVEVPIFNRMAADIFLGYGLFSM
jgi:hypothetical protein